VHEVVTVVAGIINLGMGETADRSSAKALPASRFFCVAARHGAFRLLRRADSHPNYDDWPMGIKYGRLTIRRKSE
jgi:hypothetical protein